MAKRRLNRQQKWRIDKISQEKSLRAQKKDRDISRQISSGDLSCEQKGLVISHFGKLIDVEALEGEDTGVLHRCHFRANIDNLVTGDEVIWRAGSDRSGVIETVLERRSLLQRPDSYGNLKPVASNIDNLVIVASPVPLTYSILIDRYLVAAENMHIEPVILLNKTDLIDDQNRDELEALMGSYQRLGYRILTASVVEKNGLEAFTDFLNQKNTVLAGQSGVGKSSLIKALLPDQDIRIGEVSDANMKGRHTTTTARLFHLPGGGNLIDSPGIREFGLWHMDDDELLFGFREFRPLIGTCKFRNCQHDHEPGCAFSRAVESGAISEERFANFKKLRSTLGDLNMKSHNNLTT
ncbi:MAG: ribosome biogenesis GTPase RsgA [Proteobacteria bacterium]|nr:MAG: ribosome biogenesis GTPase RsgA [Pseudomonadota bacterium]PIE39984.1 MAG: ribosome biogenesis GTPase RsgA [Gammaproteobacteria bacterium]